MLTLNDGRSELWQWDTGRTLAVDADCSQVHFSNKVFGRSIDVDVVDSSAIIPDVLLQTDKDLNVWAFVGTAENGYTKISKTFKVNRRNKPADYVFTPPDQTTLAELVERLDKIEESQDPEAIKNAVEDYLEQNPVESPVQSVNGQTGTVELTANDVGAISQDDLQAATNEALAQAKASGEFDGPQGPEGPQGPAGPAGAGMDITGATVGQIVKIKAVDENGKPTEWEAADMASGGGEKPWRYDKLIEFSEDTAGFTLDTFDDGSPFDFTEVEITAALKNAGTSSVWGDVAAVSDGFIGGNYVLVGGSNSSVSKMTNSGQWYLYYLHGVVDAVKKSVSATVVPNTPIMYINSPVVFYGNEIYQMPNFAYGTTAIQGKWETPPTKFTTVKSGMKIGAGSSIHIRGR